MIGALVQLVEQPGILDGDDRLLGKVLHQLDLLVGKRPHLLPIDSDGADQVIVLEHRRDHHGPSTPAVRKSMNRRITFEVWRLRSQVLDLYDALRPDDLGMPALRMRT